MRVREGPYIPIDPLRLTRSVDEQDPAATSLYVPWTPVPWTPVPLSILAVAGARVVLAHVRRLYYNAQRNVISSATHLVPEGPPADHQGVHCSCLSVPSPLEIFGVQCNLPKAYILVH